MPNRVSSAGAGQGRHVGAADWKRYQSSADGPGRDGGSSTTRVAGRPGSRYRYRPPRRRQGPAGRITDRRSTGSASQGAESHHNQLSHGRGTGGSGDWSWHRRQRRRRGPSNHRPPGKPPRRPEWPTLRQLEQFVVRRYKDLTALAGPPCGAHDDRAQAQGCDPPAPAGSAVGAPSGGRRCGARPAVPPVRRHRAGRRSTPTGWPRRCRARRRSPVRPGAFGRPCPGCQRQ